MQGFALITFVLFPCLLLMESGRIVEVQTLGLCCSDSLQTALARILNVSKGDGAIGLAVVCRGFKASGSPGAEAE